MTKTCGDDLLRARFMPVWVIGVTTSNDEQADDEYKWNVQIMGVYQSEQEAQHAREEFSEFLAQISNEYDLTDLLERIVAAGEINEYLGREWCGIPTAEPLTEEEQREIPELAGFDTTTEAGVAAFAKQVLAKHKAGDQEIVSIFNDWVFNGNCDTSYMFPMGHNMYAWIEATYMGGVRS